MKRLTAIAATLLLALTVPALASAQAAHSNRDAVASGATRTPESTTGGGQFVFNSMTAFGCAANATVFSLTATDMAIHPAYVDTFVTSGGATYMDQHYLVNSDGGWTWFFFDANSHGLQTAVYPIPTGQPVTHTLLLRYSDGREPFWKIEVVLGSCDVGNILSVSQGPVLAQAIPTVSPLGLAALAAVLLALGIWIMRRRSLARR
jgi:hypothetical protein